MVGSCLVGWLAIQLRGTVEGAGPGALGAMHEEGTFDLEQVLGEVEAEGLWTELSLPERNRCCLRKFHSPKVGVATEVAEEVAAVLS